MNATAHVTGIIPFTYFGGANKPVGSTFLRVNGLVDNSKDFQIWEHGHRYDSLIFQKAYWPEMMRTFRGPKILDLCDADWINGAVNIVEVGNLVDALTCSSAALTALIESYFPKKIVEHVPDRLNFKLFPVPKAAHTGKAKRVLWFGFIPNAYETLVQLSDMISKYNLKLTILADRPYENKDEISEYGFDFIQYDLKSAYHYIQQADIVLNPKSGRASFKYKSNNKTVISWKLGVPVAETSADLERLIDATERNHQLKKVKVMVEQEYNILQSAAQYRDILIRISGR